jgi:hypothetical protein
MWLDYAVPYRTCCPKWDNGKRKDEYPMSNTLKGIFDKEYPTEERDEKM